MTAGAGRDWDEVIRGLDLRLIEFRLRPPGSPPYLDDEAALAHEAAAALRRLAGEVPWLRRAGDPEVIAWGACADLLVRWRSGRLYRFTKTYLRRALLNHLRERREPSLEQSAEPADPRPQALDGLIDRELLAQLPPAVEEIRGGLPEEDSDLFAAWVARGDRRGWQSRYAEANGKSPKWVSVKLDGLREQLRIRDVGDPDEFVAGLRGLETDEQPDAEAGEETAPAPAGPVLDYEAQVRRLSAAWTGAAAVVEAYRAGRTRAEVAARLFAGAADPAAALEDGLLRLHAEFVTLAGEFRESDRAERFYRQIVNSKVADVARAAASAGPAVTADLAARLRKAAKAGEAFADLPRLLGLSAGEVVRLILELRRMV